MPEVRGVRSRSVISSVELLRLLLLELLFLALLLGMVVTMPQLRLVGTVSCAQGACGPTIVGPAAVTKAVVRDTTGLAKTG